MRSERFTVLFSPDELAALAELASLWRRSRSDVIRLLIADALSRLFSDGKQRPGQGPDSAAESKVGTEDSRGHHTH